MRKPAHRELPGRRFGFAAVAARPASPYYHPRSPYPPNPRSPLTPATSAGEAQDVPPCREPACNSPGPRPGSCRSPRSPRSTTLAARLGLRYASIGQSISLVWPPTGIAIAALVILGRNAWPGVAIGAFLANAATPIPLAGRRRHRRGQHAGGGPRRLAPRARGRRRPRLDAMGTVRALVLVAAPLGAIVSAIVGVSALMTTGALPAARRGVGAGRLVDWRPARRAGDRTPAAGLGARPPRPPQRPRPARGRAPLPRHRDRRRARPGPAAASPGPAPAARLPLPAVSVRHLGRAPLRQPRARRS